ncbi:MAG: hypothetical protein SF029_08835 [bacterium]|nr:hypothetical protein [bacterium]
MNLIIDNVQRELIDIRDFRTAHGLPADFGLAHFEPKDYTGLGSVEDAGEALNQVRATLMEVVGHGKEPITPAALLDLPAAVGVVFRAELVRINDRVGLRQMEIDFAVAGLEDVLRSVGFALARAKATRTAPPLFADLYADWLNASVRVSVRVHEIDHRGERWQVRIFNTAYGRAGLIVTLPDGTTAYVRDAALACPVEGYMGTLLRDLAEGITAGFLGK